MSDFDDYDPLADTKEVFHAWVGSFDAFHDDEYLFEQLAYCEDLLTNELCDELGLKAAQRRRSICHRSCRHERARVAARRAAIG
jgi:hypothetical protein